MASAPIRNETMTRLSAPLPHTSIAIAQKISAAGGHGSESESVCKRPARGLRAWFHPTTLMAVALCAGVSLGVWHKVEQPVAVPDFHGSVAGLAFSPFQRGQSAETNNWPTDAQIHRDLEHVAEMTGRIRTYSVQGTLADIPEMASDLPLKVTLGAWIDD